MGGWEVCKKSVVNKAYHNQAARSERRGHKPPAYSYEDLYDWAMSQPKFHELYALYVDGGCKWLDKPSFDRTDNSKGYCLSRIKIVTVRENIRSYNFPGCSNGKTKPVIGRHLDTDEVVAFPSTREAGREIDTNHSHIAACCRGEMRQAGGFSWQYTGS